MDFKSITEKFLTLEKEFKLFEKKIGNINFWDLIRWQVHSEILQRKGLYGQAHTNLKQGHIYRIKYFLRVLKNTVLNNPF